MEHNQDFEMFVDKMEQFFVSVPCINLLKSWKTWVFGNEHRSKQGGLALSISDHMCQRVGAPISL
jgi:hypothetical protein